MPLRRAAGDHGLAGSEGMDQAMLTARSLVGRECELHVIDQLLDDVHGRGGSQRLHQQRQDSAARAPLRAAREAFDALGVIPWSERARQQLRATGETSRPRTPEARDQLTPQELQIVQMAAEGLSNRAIGQKLYLSHRTVSSHLYRVFPKLGITSRTELRAALSAATPNLTQR